MPTVVPVAMAMGTRADVNLRCPVKAAIASAMAPMAMTVVTMTAVTMAIVALTMPPAMSHRLHLANFTFGDRWGR